MATKICDLCIIAHIDPDLRERLGLERWAIGITIELAEWKACDFGKHMMVMESAISAFRRPPFVN